MCNSKSIDPNWSWLSNSFRRGMSIAVAFLDFSKAFGKVNDKSCCMQKFCQYIISGSTTTISTTFSSLVVRKVFELLPARLVLDGVAFLHSKRTFWSPTGIYFGTFCYLPDVFLPINTIQMFKSFKYYYWWLYFKKQSVIFISGVSVIL